MSRRRPPPSIDDDRFPLPPSNPRLFPPDRRPRPPPSDHRPSPPLLFDRFCAMVRHREEDLLDSPYGDFDDDPSPALATREIVRLFEEVLSELTFNSKPIISELTMIASDQREHAQGIADAVCNRILKVPVDQKLPSMYLLDSLVKNIGREYVRHFSARLPKVFCEAYNQVDPRLYPALRHLFGTWSQVFHPSVLRKIEDELQFVTPLNQRSTGLADMRQSESPSPRPSHGIHVNPKYLEARHQLEHSTSESPKGWSKASPKFHDVQNLRDVSSSLQACGQKPYVRYGDYDFDHSELPHSRHRAGSPRTAAVRSSSMVEVEGPPFSLKCRESRPTSPPVIGLKRSISPADDRFQGDISLRKAESASPSRSTHGFWHEGMSDQNGWRDTRRPSDDDSHQRESPIGYNLDNGYANQRSRELIDAYGSQREIGDSREKHPKVRRLDVIGINSEATARNWQSSEEEEYVWENMSPTLADHSNRSTQQPFRPFSGRPGLSRPEDSPLEPDFRRSSWADQASLRPIIDEDKISVPRFGHGSMNKIYLDGTESQNESLLHYKSSHRWQGPRVPGSYPYPLYSQQIRSRNSQGRVPQGPCSTSGTIPSIGQNLPGPYDNLHRAEVPFRSLSNIHSGNSNVDTPAIEKHWTQRPYSPPRPAPVVWPPVCESQPLPLPPIPPNQKHFRSPYEFIEGNKPELKQGPYLDSKTRTLNKPPHLTYPDPGSGHVRQQTQELSNTRCQSQETHGSFIPPTQSHLASYLVPQPLSHVHTQGQVVVKGSDFSISLPPPSGSHPASSQVRPTSGSISSILSSGLVSTLMAQGLISLAPPGQSQGSVGVEFNAELLKVRHESAINALYTDLPRQCTTCGLRFKFQEEHSSHMDWHVTKNRISKNHKQKPSRKWFVSGNEWLSGAEILGTDVVPGFLPTEAVTERKKDEEMAVPADECQDACALCGEVFEYFYSDETEEWMYKHAVYLNAPNGSIEGFDHSQWGPIVHAKCRPESAEDIGQS